VEPLMYLTYLLVFEEGAESDGEHKRTEFWLNRIKAIPVRQVFGSGDRSMTKRANRKCGTFAGSIIDLSKHWYSKSFPLINTAQR
jgi:hypothetical protein